MARKTARLAATLCATLLVPVAAVGRDAADPPSAPRAAAKAGDKVGYVDVGHALNEVNEGKAAIARLKSEMEKRQDQVIKQREQLKEKMEKFDKQSAVMKPEARADRQRELQQEMDELQKTIVQVQQDLMESQTQVTEEIGKKLRRVVEKIGDREGYTQIFTTEGLLYFKRHLDITAEVVQAYNRQYGGK